MEMFMEWSGPIIGVIGWAATVIVILRATRITLVQKHAIVVLSWMMWMFPGFDILVRRDLIHGDVAMNYFGGLTVVLATFVFLSALRMRARS